MNTHLNASDASLQCGICFSAEQRTMAVVQVAKSQQMMSATLLLIKTTHAQNTLPIGCKTTKFYCRQKRDAFQENGDMNIFGGATFVIQQSRSCHMGECCVLSHAPMQQAHLAQYTQDQMS